MLEWRQFLAASASEGPQGIAAIRQRLQNLSGWEATANSLDAALMTDGMGVCLVTYATQVQVVLLALA